MWLLLSSWNRAPSRCVLANPTHAAYQAGNGVEESSRDESPAGCRHERRIPGTDIDRRGSRRRAACFPSIVDIERQLEGSHHDWFSAHPAATDLRPARPRRGVVFRTAPTHAEVPWLRTRECWVDAVRGASSSRMDRIEPAPRARTRNPTRPERSLNDVMSERMEHDAAA